MTVDLNKDIIYKHASMRYFKAEEHHVKRFCADDVLLLVFDGVLRFSEDGEEKEVPAGHYYVQRRGCMQDGVLESDSPKYLYVHFFAEYTENGGLELSGPFDTEKCFPLMQKLDTAAHTSGTLTECKAIFYSILTLLSEKYPDDTCAVQIEKYLRENYGKRITLGELSSRFGYSENRTITLFSQKYGVTPFVYLNRLRLQKAEYLLEVTSDTVEKICYLSGFNDYSRFYKAFCEKNGMSPTQFRRKMRG